MDLIKVFLEKYKKLTNNHNLLRDIIIDSINNEIGLLLKKEDIKILNNIVYIKTNPILKSEIFINKEKIINSINKNLPTGVIKDIK